MRRTESNTTPSARSQKPSKTASTPKAPPKKRRKIEPSHDAVNLDEPLTSSLPDNSATNAPVEDEGDGSRTVKEMAKVTKKKPSKKIKEPTPEPVLEHYQPRSSNSWKIGAHVSAAGGVENAVTNAASIGANAFALFLKSNRKWTNPPLTDASIKKFRNRLAVLNYDPSLILPHATYLINLGHPLSESREKAYVTFVDELQRCQQLGLTLLNFHPGGTVGQISKEECIGNIAACLNRAHKEVPTIVTVIECMAGHKNVIGCDWQDLADIIALVGDKSRVGVCLDTCHMFSAGYDLRSKENYGRTMSTFQEVVGFSYLKGMHLNDSKAPFGSKKDRHENIGVGSIGLEALGHIVSDIRMKNLPLILETPGFDCKTVWAKEIDVLNRVSLRLQGGQELTEEESVMVDEIKMAIKRTEADGWAAKGKAKAITTKKGTIASKKGKGKRKADDDEADISIDGGSSLTELSE
ncbi:hypothetical protein FRB95_013571 [Tulasnella sp. JGI-2019a]|nr:hypothetical protein FRB95_013571 [Tulasnella sp. JGI-2019a]